MNTTKRLLVSGLISLAGIAGCCSEYKIPREHVNLGLREGRPLLGLIEGFTAPNCDVSKKSLELAYNLGLIPNSSVGNWGGHVEHIILANELGLPVIEGGHSSGAYEVVLIGKKLEEINKKTGKDYHIDLFFDIDGTYTRNLIHGKIPRTIRRTACITNTQDWTNFLRGNPLKRSDFESESPNFKNYFVDAAHLEIMSSSATDYIMTLEIEKLKKEHKK